MSAPVVVCALDGVLCNDRSRRRLLRDGRREEYHALALEDMPVWPTLRVLRGMQSGGCEIVLYENRPEASRGITTKWLKEFGVDYDWLVLGTMKDVGDHIRNEGGQIFAAVVGDDNALKFFRLHPHRPFVFQVSQEGLCYP